jgi:hypothetical protein
LKQRGCWKSGIIWRKALTAFTCRPIGTGQDGLSAAVVFAVWLGGEEVSAELGWGLDGLRKAAPMAPSASVKEARLRRRIVTIHIPSAKAR